MNIQLFSIFIIFFIATSSCTGGGYTCGEQSGPGVVTCFPSDNCYDRSCVLGKCVSTPKCQNGQVCDPMTKLCRANGNTKKDVKEETKKEVNPSVGRNYHDDHDSDDHYHENLIKNGRFDDGLNHWTNYSFLDSFGDSGCSWNQYCFFDDCFVIWDNICGPNGGYFYQDFEIPYTDCITQFHLTFQIGYNNTANNTYIPNWVLGNSEVEPLDNLFLQAQSIRIQITTEDDVILKELFDTKPWDPTTTPNFLHKQFEFNAKKFPFELLNFPTRLRLRFRITATQAELIVLIRDVKLSAKCKKSEHHEKKQLETFVDFAMINE
jgi:hypothetical protein